MSTLTMERCAYLLGLRPNPDPELVFWRKKAQARSHEVAALTEDNARLRRELRGDEDAGADR